MGVCSLNTLLGTRAAGAAMKVVVPLLVCALALLAVASAKPNPGKEQRALAENLESPATMVAVESLENLRSQEMEVGSLENLAWKERAFALTGMRFQCFACTTPTLV